MKNKLIILLMMPMLMATQCENDDIECSPDTLVKTKQNLITIENLQDTYNRNDILWIKSDLSRNISFNNSSETIDLFNYDQLTYSFNFDRLSAFNSEMYLCVNEKTIEIVQGKLLNCNQILYEKTDTNFQSKIGIKLVESGNYRIRISQISNKNSDCNVDKISIVSSFSNNDDEWILFSVK